MDAGNSTVPTVITTFKPGNVADDGHALVNQIFKLEYCGLDDGDFWSWCKEPTFEPITTRCKKISGGSEDRSCQGIVKFENKNLLTYKERCQLGGEADKFVEESFSQALPEGKFEDISDYCKGRGNFTWWIILLVIALCAIVLGISSWLFWKFYLRRKVRPTAAERKQDSMLQSRYTSAPLSEMPTRVSVASGNSGLGSLYTVNTSDAMRSRSTSGRRNRSARVSGSYGMSSAQRSSRVPSTSMNSSLPPSVASSQRASSSGAFR